jgi:DNA mismatch repair ATPase MutL
MQQPAKLVRLPAGTRDLIQAAYLTPDPSSIALHLVHNALDAGASRVRVTLDLSRLRVEVQDDGCGFREDELRDWVGTDWCRRTGVDPALCYGRRGAALWSMGAHSVLEVTSRPPGSRSAHVKTVRGSRCIRFAQAPADDALLPSLSLSSSSNDDNNVVCTPSSGEGVFSFHTSVCVWDMLTSVPVRRRAFTSNGPSLHSEAKKVKLSLERCALAHPSVVIEFCSWPSPSASSDSHSLKALSSGPRSREGVFREICGQRALDATFPVSHHESGLHLSGRMSPPSSLNSHYNCDWQFLCMAGRWWEGEIPSRLLSIINSSFSKCWTLLQGRQPRGVPAPPPSALEFFPIFFLRLDGLPAPWDPPDEAQACRAEVCIISFLLEFLSQHQHAVPDSLLAHLRSEKRWRVKKGLCQEARANDAALRLNAKDFRGMSLLTSTLISPPRSSPLSQPLVTSPHFSPSPPPQQGGFSRGSILAAFGGAIDVTPQSLSGWFHSGASCAQASEEGTGGGEDGVAPPPLPQLSWLASFGGPMADPALATPITLTSEHLSGCTVVGQAGKKFVLAVSRQLSSSPPLLLCVDQHAADERIRLEDLECRAKVRDPSILSLRRLPAPLPLELTPAELVSVRQHERALSLWHFTVGLADAQGRSLLLTAPVVCGVSLACSANLRDILDFSHQSNASAGPLLPDCVEHVLKQKACRGAIKFGDSLTHKQCVVLLDRLSRCSLPFQCAHGRPSAVPLLEL